MNINIVILLSIINAAYAARNHSPAVYEDVNENAHRPEAARRARQSRVSKTYNPQQFDVSQVRQQDQQKYRYLQQQHSDLQFQAKKTNSAKPRPTSYSRQERVVPSLKEFIKAADSKPTRSPFSKQVVTTLEKDALGSAPATIQRRTNDGWKIIDEPVNRHARSFKAKQLQLAFLNNNEEQTERGMELVSQLAGKNELSGFSTVRPVKKITIKEENVTNGETVLTNVYEINRSDKNRKTSYEVSEKQDVSFDATREHEVLDTIDRQDSHRSVIRVRVRKTRKPKINPDQKATSSIHGLPLVYAQLDNKPEPLRSNLHALNALIGKHPEQQLQGLHNLLHSETRHPDSLRHVPAEYFHLKDHTPITEHVHDVENPHSRPNVQVLASTTEAPKHYDVSPLHFVYNAHSQQQHQRKPSINVKIVPTTELPKHAEVQPQYVYYKTVPKPVAATEVPSHYYVYKPEDTTGLKIQHALFSPDVHKEAEALIKNQAEEYTLQQAQVHQQLLNVAEAQKITKTNAEQTKAVQTQYYFKQREKAVENDKILQEDSGDHNVSNDCDEIFKILQYNCSKKRRKRDAIFQNNANNANASADYDVEYYEYDYDSDGNDTEIVYYDYAVNVGDTDSSNSNGNNNQPHFEKLVQLTTPATPNYEYYDDSYDDYGDYPVVDLTTTEVSADRRYIRSKTSKYKHNRYKPYKKRKRRPSHHHKHHNHRHQYSPKPNYYQTNYQATPKPPYSYLEPDLTSNYHSYHPPPSFKPTYEVVSVSTSKPYHIPSYHHDIKPKLPTYKSDNAHEPANVIVINNSNDNHHHGGGLQHSQHSNQYHEPGKAHEHHYHHHGAAGGNGGGHRYHKSPSKGRRKRVKKRKRIHRPRRGNSKRIIKTIHKIDAAISKLKHVPIQTK